MKIQSANNKKTEDNMLKMGWFLKMQCASNKEIVKRQCYNLYIFKTQCFDMKKKS